MVDSVGNMEEKNRELKALFKQHMSWFREAIYLLTGWKVDMKQGAGGGKEQATIKLRSVFAEREDDMLMFSWGSGGLELLETTFVKRLDTKIFTYLRTCKSIPAFTSAVTMHLFEMNTFTQGRGKDLVPGLRVS